jgi:hypothetical protein
MLNRRVLVTTDFTDEGGKMRLAVTVRVRLVTYTTWRSRPVWPTVLPSATIASRRPSPSRRVSSAPPLATQRRLNDENSREKVHNVRGEIARQITIVSHNHLRSMVSAPVDEQSELMLSGGG